MRRGLLRAVSSALLLLSLVSMPHPGEAGESALASAATVSPAIVISEFYPCALAGDEYFTISCIGNGVFCMRNWSLTDGEGEIKFVSDVWIFPGRPFTVSNNATSFYGAFDRMPDLALGSPGSGNLVAVSGSLKLADAGDSLSLLSSDRSIADAVVYGTTDDVIVGWAGAPIPALRKGEVAKRLVIDGCLTDTNTAEDWMPFREYRYGYTGLSSSRFEIPAGNMMAFTSPDSSCEVVAGAVDHASESICVCTYEFSSELICRKLLDAAAIGVKVRLLVDGVPAGDMSDGEIACLSALCLGGCEVLLVKGNQSRGIVQHVGALHAKYMVVDSSISIIMSENFVDDGLPQNKIFGNRGWGVMIADAKLAAYLKVLFDSDSRLGRPDVSDWRCDARYNDSQALLSPPIGATRCPLLEPLVSTQIASVTVIPSPDGSVLHPYLSNILRAERSLAVEQFQADLYWTSRWTGQRALNPLVQSIQSSASRGAEGRILLDSSWFNLERNLQVVDCMKENSTQYGQVECGLLDERSPITLLHNKGAVIDCRITVVSSNNWVQASFSRNRELAAVIDSEEIATYFLKAFDFDWSPDKTPPICNAGQDTEIVLGRSVVLDAGACSDDRLISEYSWDIDADGVIDSHDDQILFEALVEGEHVVVLEVVDAWGNSAADEIRISVISGTAIERNTGTSDVLRILWTIPIFAAIGLLAKKAIDRGRSPPSSRNLNHRPRH